jgi:hypothetical protein
VIVFDVVMVVSCGARTSVPVGRWWVDTWDSKSEADRRADRYNVCRHADDGGYIYLVERHDEECRGRAPLIGEMRISGACTCRTSQDAPRAIGTGSVDTHTGRA